MAISKIPSAGFQDNVKFRNIIINSDMSIAQRGTSATGIGNGDTGYHTVDRWKFFENDSPSYEFTMSQSTDVPSGYGFATSLKMDCTTAEASLAAADLAYLEHYIEGQNVQYLKKGTANAEYVTASFWVKSTKTGTFIVELVDLDNSRFTNFNYTVNVSDTWEKKTVTFVPDTTGTLDNDNAASLLFRFGLLAGTTYSSGAPSPTTWLANSGNNAKRAANQVNIADNTANNFLITGIQLEAGTTASEFEFLPTDINLRRCQRYFEICGAAFTGGVSSSGTNVDGSVQYSVNKRSDNGQSYSLARTTSALANPGIVAINASSIAAVQSNRTSIGAYLSITVDATTADRKVSTYYQNWLKVDDEL